MKEIRVCPPLQRAECVGLRIELDDGDSTNVAEFRNEGNGFFIVLTTMADNKEIRMDPDEIVKFSAWAAEVCAALDQQKTHLGERD